MPTRDECLANFAAYVISVLSEQYEFTPPAALIEGNSPC